MSFEHLKEGDIVVRMLAGKIPMALKVTEVKDKTVVCGSYVFDRKTGMEEDHDLGWGVSFGVTGSFLKSTQ